jgi:hypothetical protein
LPLDFQGVEQGQDAKLVVQGQQFVEGAAGSDGGQVGTLAFT